MTPLNNSKVPFPPRTETSFRVVINCSHLNFVGGLQPENSGRKCFFENRVYRGVAAGDYEFARLLPYVRFQTPAIAESVLPGFPVRW